MKNKELGREKLLKIFEREWTAIHSEAEAYQQIKSLIQRSGEKPEIDEKFIEEKEREEPLGKI